MTNSLHTHLPPNQPSSDTSASRQSSSSRLSTDSDSSSDTSDGIKSLVQISAETQVAILLARVHVLVLLSKVTEADDALSKAGRIADEFQNKFLLSRCYFWSGILWIRNSHIPNAIDSFLNATSKIRQGCPEAGLLLRILQWYEPWVRKHYEHDQEEANVLMEAIRDELCSLLDNECPGMRDIPPAADSNSWFAGSDSPFGEENHETNNTKFNARFTAAQNNFRNRLDMELKALGMPLPPHDDLGYDTTAENKTPVLSSFSPPPQSAYSAESQRSFTPMSAFMPKLIQADPADSERRRERANAAMANIARHKEMPRDLKEMRVENKIPLPPSGKAVAHFPNGGLSPTRIDMPEIKPVEKPQDVILSDTLALQEVDSRIETIIGRRKSVGDKVNSPPSHKQRALTLNSVPSQRRMSTDPQCPSPLRAYSMPG